MNNYTPMNIKTVVIHGHYNKKYFIVNKTWDINIKIMIIPHDKSLLVIFVKGIFKICKDNFALACIVTISAIIICKLIIMVLKKFFYKNRPMV